jgi:transposase
VPALPSWLTDPLWDQFAALLPARETYVSTHPWGCHRRRIADRIVFDKLLQVLRFGCSYQGIADSTCSATTIRAHATSCGSHCRCGTASALAGRSSRNTGSPLSLRPPPSPLDQLHRLGAARERLRSPPWPLCRVLAVLRPPSVEHGPVTGKQLSRGDEAVGVRVAGEHEPRLGGPAACRSRISSPHLVTGAAHRPGRPCGPDGTTAPQPPAPRRNDITG